VNCEALLIASRQNLKRLLQQRGWGRRPLPSGAALQVAVYVLLIWVWRTQAALQAAQARLKPKERARLLASYQ
jgi:hypothetical protein